MHLIVTEREDTDRLLRSSFQEIPIAAYDYAERFGNTDEDLRIYEGSINYFVPAEQSILNANSEIDFVE